MITELSGLEQAVAFTFLLVFFAMAAAAVFLFAERGDVAPEYRVSVAVSALVCAIAAGNYWFMREIYVDGATGAGTGAFPTEFRYIDWFLTVPLMLALFPAHLGLGRHGRAFMTWLITAALVMLAAGYVGEINPDDPVLHLGGWAVGCLAGLALYVPLFLSLRRLPDRVPRHTVVTIRAMTALVLLGWTVYPLGYLQPALGFPPDVRELLYNVGDAVNKVGLGVLVYLGGRAAARTRDSVVRAAAPTPARTPAESLLAGRN
ncbi:MAG: bacteriorhodopsin [Kineosporiaceae bacterium]